MARQNNKTNNNPRRVNPNEMTRVRVPRPKISFDGTILRTSNMCAPFTTITTLGVGTHLFPIDCATAYTGTLTTGFGCNPAITWGPLTGFYEQYRVTSFSATWLPFGGPNSLIANTRMYAIIDSNPEHIQAHGSSPGPTVLARMQNDRNLKTWNAWERVTFTWQLPQRRKWFDVNNNIDINDPNAISRSITAILLTACDGGPISGPTALGAWQVHATVNLQGLSNTNT